MVLRGRPTRRGNRQGAVAVMVAVCLTAMMAFVAIAVDGGMLLQERRRVQAAADAAALAAADQLFANYATDYGTDPNGYAAKTAKTTASANGYVDGDGVSTVTVNIPPKSGPFTSATQYPGYVEVIVTYDQPRYFSGVFSFFNSAAIGPLPVKGRAVARGQWVKFNEGIICLDPSASGALTVRAGGQLVVKNAPIVLDSNSSSAASVAQYGSVTVGTMEVTGTNPGYSGTVQGTVKTGVAPLPDPLAYLPAPDPLSMPNGSSTTDDAGNVTLQPGYFSSALYYGGATSVTMAAGIYYVNGDFSLAGSASLNAQGVMIYVTGALNLGGGNVTWSPPTSGAYKGLAYFQSRSSTTEAVFSGSGQYTLTGTFYAPVAVTHFRLNVVAALAGQIVSNQVLAGRDTQITIDWNGHPLARTRMINLVE
jgi:Flp pilus assembly protein TadG